MVRTTQLSETVLANLSGVQVDGKIVRLTAKLERKEYLEVNKALEALGGKWNRKSKGHVLAEDPAERIDLAILTGQIERPQDFGFFPTPFAVAARIAEVSGIKDGDQVLEPSAGQGALIDAVLERAPGAHVTAIELLESNVGVLRLKYASMRILQGDFLNMPRRAFDRVVMNPPFSKHQDIMHVCRARDWLAPGGRLVAVMSAGITFRQDRLTVAFREFTKNNDAMIEHLPPESFKVSGTMVNTVLVTVNRGAR